MYWDPYANTSTTGDVTGALALAHGRAVQQIREARRRAEEARRAAEIQRLLEAIKREAKRARRPRAAPVVGPRCPPAPAALEARHGYQEMARLPCYRGVRTR